MKLVSMFAVLCALLATSAQAASIFDKIADDSDFGNGSWEIKKYNNGLSRKEIQEIGKKELEKAYWQDCGPWKVITSRREAIDELEKLNGQTARFTKEKKSKIADKITALYEKDKIVAVVSAISNREVECSVTWFNFYGADGTMIELRYNMGD